MKIFKSAFTMAELLIALTIIGVIATLTLPTLTGNVDNKQFAVTLRKTITAMNQAVAINAAESGVNFSGAANMSTADVFDQIFIGRMGATLDEINTYKVTSEGAEFTAFTDDLVSATDNHEFTDGAEGFAGDQISQQFKATAGTNIQPARIYKMKDGLATIIIPGSNFNDATHFNCNDQGEYYLGPNNGYNRHFCIAYLDVNGKKGPNIVARCSYGNDNKDCDSDGHHCVSHKLNGDLNVERCFVADVGITDIYPVLLFGSKVVLATRAGLAVLQDVTRDAQ